jgi:hypothetical protein
VKKALWWLLLEKKKLDENMWSRLT